MQERPGCQRDLAPAPRTLPTSLLHQFIGPTVTTARTDEAIRPAAGCQVLPASLFGGELRLEFAQRFWKRRTRHLLYTTGWGLLKQPDKQKLTKVERGEKLQQVEVDRLTRLRTLV